MQADLVVPGPGGPETVGKVELAWEPVDATTFAGRAASEAKRQVSATGKLRVLKFVRGRLPSVSASQAVVLGSLSSTGARPALERFAHYLRCGVEGTSQPKAGEVQLGGGLAGRLLLVGHRGPQIQLLAEARPEAAKAREDAAAAASAGATPSHSHVPSAAAAGASISKVAAAAAAADAPATVYAGPDSALPAKVASQRRRLFRGLPEPVVQAMRLDDVALFSVTALPAAREMTALVERHCSPDAVVIDGTACVGGNSISFGQELGGVLSCEISGQRCGLLAHNLAQALGAKPAVAESAAEVRGLVGGGGRLTVFHGPVQDLLLAPLPGVEESSWPSLGDALFLDPPWGGPEYKLLPRLSLFLGETNVADMLPRIARAAVEQRAAGAGGRLHRLRLVALKGPFNLDVEEVLAKGRGLLTLAQPAVFMEKGRVQLLLLRVQDRPAQQSSKRPRDASAAGGPAEPDAQRPRGTASGCAAAGEASAAAGGALAAAADGGT